MSMPASFAPSATRTAARPAPAASPRTTTRLRLVRPPQQARTRVPFVLLCMGILGAALIAALLLNTSMAQAAFATSAVRTQLQRAQQDGKDLQSQIDTAASPDQLAAKARSIGMVPATSTGWIRLADGTVTAVATPAKR